MQFLLCFALVNNLILNVYGLPVSNTTVEDYDVPTASIEKKVLASEYPVMSSSNCTFMADSNNIQAKIKSEMQADTNLLVFNINFAGLSGSILGSEKGNIYEPTRWLIPHGHLGKQLLLLQYNFKTLSLSTLSLNIHEMDIYLIQTNPSCTENIYDSSFETVVREYILNNLMESGAGDNICNMHIYGTNGDAVFSFYCCHRVQNNTTDCKDLTRDTWLNTFFTIIDLLKLCVLLFAPVFFPRALFGVQDIARMYTHCLGNTPSNLNVLVTKTPNSYPDAKVSLVNYLPRFKEIVQTLNQDVVHQLKVTQINMKIKQEDLIPENCAPVGLLSLFYDWFVRCKIRKRNSGICSCTIPICKCLRSVMRICIMSILASPILMKICLYLAYEQKEIEARGDAALRRGLSFDGNDIFYSIFIYTYWLFAIVFFACLNRSAQQRCIFFLKKGFRNMRERNISALLERAISPLLIRSSSSGVKERFKQIVCWILKLPLLAIIILCYTIPTINLLINVICHSYFSIFGNNARLRINRKLSSIKKKLGLLDIAKTETSETDEQELHEINQHVVFRCIYLSVWMVLLQVGFLIMADIASFLVDVAAYTLLGIIINEKTTLTYLSLIFLLFMYGHSCFSHVVNRYTSFNRTLITFLLDLSKQNIEELTCLPGDKKGNVAIRLKTNNLRAFDDSWAFVNTKRGLLRWRTSGLVLFLGKNYMPSIPKKFFFKACKMPYYLCPGKLLFNYLRAVGELSIIFAFLLFVLVIVMSFSETQQLSMSNQLLATLAGGIMPWILTKVMSRTRVSPSLDTSNTNFKTCISELLDKYKQGWSIEDIMVKDIEVVHEHGGELALAENEAGSVAASTKQIDLIIDGNNVDSAETIREPLLSRPLYN